MSFLRAPGVSDLLDIACVTFIIYSLLVWFKRARAAFVARGLLILAAVYIFARLMNMRMTVWIFQGFFAVFIIAVVVIFQEELRHFFERLAVLSFKRGQAAPAASQQVESVVRAAANLSRDKIGALIVLKGRDPLERHVEGGWDLNGELSQAILESIFDYHSLGHDGAVLVEYGKVSRFGCHLPLSKNFAKLNNLGTRHTAALGLAERTDALCLAVSEERGTISLARDNDLRAVESLEDLTRELEAFYRDKAAAPASKDLMQFLKHNTREKAAALGLAVLIWVLFLGLR